MWYLSLIERGLVPDPLIRSGIRRLLQQKLDEESRGGVEQHQEAMRGFLSTLRESPIAVNTDDANEQHYELPPAFFERVLGHRLKYSCGLWAGGEPSGGLDAAEDRMLELYAERARLADGMQVLDLGCGWGSLSLWMAARYPQSEIVAVSNSAVQREFILERARSLGIANVTVQTLDVNQLDLGRQFDRIVSVEMMEHVRNYADLMRRVAGHLRDDGLLFVHIFTHRHHAYPFVAEDDADWLARHFFAGGTMPSDHLLLYFQDDVRIVDHWVVDGTHYARTANAWLANMNRHRALIEPILAEVYGNEQVGRWWMNWRLFFLACAELWGYRNGQEWLVSHYLFRKATAG